MERKLGLALIPCFFLLLLFVPSVEATVDIRYMTSTHVGSDLGNQLSTTQSVSPVTTIIGTYDGDVSVTQYLGIRVWLNHTDKTLTEVTSGTAIAIASGSTTDIISAAWSCPTTSMVTTDRVQIKVYANDFSPPATQKDTYWQTEALSTTVLNSATWTVYYYLSRAYNSRTKITTYSFGFGSSAMNSRIENFTYGEAGAQEYTYTLTQAFAVSASNQEWKEKRFTGSNTVVVDSAFWLGKEALMANSELVVPVWQTGLSRAFGFGLDAVTATVSSSASGIESLFTPTQTVTISASVIIGLERTLTEWAFSEVVQIADSLGFVLEGVAEEVFLFFELWMDVLWIPLVSVPFLLALWFSRRRKEDE